MTLPFLAAAIMALSATAAEPTPDSSSAPLDRIRSLSDRWRSGELSAQEKDELLRALSWQVLGVKSPEAPATDASEKVIAVYRDRNTTKLVLQAVRPLVAGSQVFLGPREVPATLHELLSRSGDRYYYYASAPGKLDVSEGGAVATEKTRRLAVPSAFTLKIQENYTFEQKRLGEVTAVQDGRAMIDRGTLHEVHERDIYGVVDSSGSRKGFLEVRGIGDLQSSGVLYNRFEDRRRGASGTQPGDRVVFLGQRKLFALGGLYGVAFGGREEYSEAETGYGAGLAWNITFKNGWGFEALFGTFERRLDAEDVITQAMLPGPRNVVTTKELDWKASYLFPMALKKNFFHPSVVSPFALIGGALFRGKLEMKDTVFDPSGTLSGQALYADSTQSFAPMVGGGVEFFPARLIRPRLDVRWFKGPTVRVRDKAMSGEKLYLSFSLFSAW